MSSREIRVSVKNCIAVALAQQADKFAIRTLIDACESEEAIFPISMAGWRFSNKEIKVGNEMYGMEIKKGKMVVAFVICEGDDDVYFVADKKSDLKKFAADWEIGQPIEHDVELWTVS